MPLFRIFAKLSFSMEHIMHISGINYFHEISDGNIIFNDNFELI
jgi:hypothetical protein